ncbi:MAG: hypothetical protein GY937_16100 [bacterium]|nr:hypothetical protein [bacterium]
MTKPTTVIVVVAFSLAGAAASAMNTVRAPAPDESLPPTPTLHVTLERDALSAGDRVGGWVSIANPSAIPLSSAKLRLQAPAFIDLGEPAECKDLPGGRVDLGSVDARQVLDEEFCVWAENEISEGSVNVVFVLDYCWTEGAPGCSQALIEKTLRCGVFGTEVVGGVSLAFIALVLPGLLFFMSLRLGGVVTSTTFAATEIATLSVLLSMVLVWAGAFLARPEVDQGMSPGRVLALCGVATGTAWVIAGVVGGLHRLTKARLVPKDEDAVAVFKRLARAGAGPGPSSILETNGEFVGALGGETVDGGWVVVGWMRFIVEDEKLRGRLKELAKKNKLHKLIRLAEREKLEMNVSDLIKQRGEDGVFTPTIEETHRVTSANLQSTKAEAPDDFPPAISVEG